MNTDDSPNILAAAASRGFSFFAGLGLRLLVHFSSLVAAGIAAASLDMPDGRAWINPAAVTVTAYIGLVCLLPRGMGKTASWLIPTCLGFAQCLIWGFWGVPWQLTLLWGGLLTWIVRLLAKKGDLGWEWTAAPWLLIAGYGFFTELAPIIRVSPPYWTIPTLALAGWGALLLHGRLTFDPVQRKKLAAACDRLEALLDDGDLPDPLPKTAALLLQQGRGLGRVLPRVDKGSAALIADIEALAARLARCNGRSEAWSGDTQALAAEADRLNARLGERLREFAARELTLDAALAARIEEFHRQSLALAAKKDALPPDMQARINGIAAATEHILDCMRTDPQDVAPADKFLSRYLTAAHTVVDEYARLAGQGGMHESVAQALGRSAQLLERLEKAFTDEHGRLLQNDTVNFTAELNVLDKLLKMEGR